MADVERRRPCVETAAGGLDLDQSPGTVPVSRWQPVQLVLRHPKRGVGHPEGPENVLGQMLTERAARHPRDEDAEYGKRMVIAPSFSRLERQRKFGQPTQPLLSAHHRRFRASLRA